MTASPDHRLTTLEQVRAIVGDEVPAVRTKLFRAHGTPNSSTSGYHETVTRAYVCLLAEFLAHCPVDLPVADCVTRVLAGPLAAKDVLLTFYSRERLMSVTARAEWVEPDLAPLRMPPSVRRA